MKKIALPIFCMLLIAVSFFGCKNNNAEESSGNTSSGSSAVSQSPTDEILSQLEDTNSMLSGLDDVTSEDISIPNP